MTESRLQKSADQLAVGDWLAPMELTDAAAEVLHIWPYPGPGGLHIHLVVREQGSVAPYADVVSGGWLTELATDAELAELRESVERAQRIKEIRQFANWLEANPFVPMPTVTAYAHLRDPGADVARVRAIAEKLGLKTGESLEDRTDVDVRIGHVQYSAIAWHKDGRPDELKPWESAAPLADRIAESMEPIADPTCGDLTHDHSTSSCLGPRPADPTGFDYSREPDEDVTPGRIPPHFESGVTEC